MPFCQTPCFLVRGKEAWKLYSVGTNELVLELDAGHSEETASRISRDYILSQGIR